MPTQLWFRSPKLYVKELLECNERNIIFDYGYIHKHKLDPQKFCDLWFGTNDKAYRLLVTGEQGTAEYRPGVEKPVAVYATWQYGEDEGILEEYLINNLGDDPDVTSAVGIPIEMVPVAGQEHRVVILNPPDLGTGPGKLFLKFLKELQEEYPDAIIHMHGPSTFSTMVRLGFKSFDWEPRLSAAGGVYNLPTGKQVKKTENRIPHVEWLRVLGLKPVDMDEPRMRCICNIRAAAWACANFSKDLKIVKVSSKVDSTSTPAEYDPETDPASSYFFKQVTPLPGDKYVCDSCSLMMFCKFAREGSVCTLPSSEPKALSSFFKTRDSSSIVDGLQEVMEIQIDRFKEGRDMEKFTGELSKEVTSIASIIFAEGVQLAKLVDPTLRNPKVQVNVGNNGGQTVMQLGDPKQFIAQAVRELEAQGFSKEQITGEMIQSVLRGAGARPMVEAKTFPEEKVVDI